MLQWLRKKNSESEEESVFYRKFRVETTAEAVIEFSVCQLIYDLSLPKTFEKLSITKSKVLFCFCFCGCFCFFFSFRINFSCGCELVRVLIEREGERLEREREVQRAANMGTSAAVGGTGSRWNNITIADQGLHELLMMFAALLVVLISSHHLLLLPHTAAAAAATTGGYMDQGCGTSGAVLAAAAAATVAINTLNFSTSNLTCIDKMWPSGSPDNHFLLWVCMQCMFPPLLLLECQLLLRISTQQSLCLCSVVTKARKIWCLKFLHTQNKFLSISMSQTLFQKICEIAEEFGRVCFFFFASASSSSSLSSASFFLSFFFFSSFDDLTTSVMTQFVTYLLSTYQSFRRRACL